MAISHETLAEEAHKNNRPDMDDAVDDRLPVTNPMACENTGLPAFENWWNWVPNGAVEYIKTGNDPRTALADLAEHALGRWMEQSEVEGVTPNMSLGAYKAVARRALKGALGEIAFVDTLDKRVLTNEEIMARTDFNSVQQIEDAGIDVMTADGKTYQVKTSKTERDWDKKQADELVWVKVDDDGAVVGVKD